MLRIIKYLAILGALFMILDVAIHNSNGFDEFRILGWTGISMWITILILLIWAVIYSIIKK